MEVKIETEAPDYPKDEQGNIPLDVTDKVKEAEKRKRKEMLDK